MTKGMLAFAIPIFFSNLFQQLYNAADSLIVGSFLGENALAAVGPLSGLVSLERPMMTTNILQHYGAACTSGTLWWSYRSSRAARSFTGRIPPYLYDLPYGSAYKQWRSTPRKPAQSLYPSSRQGEAGHLQALEFPAAGSRLYRKPACAWKHLRNVDLYRDPAWWRGATVLRPLPLHRLFIGLRWGRHLVRAIAVRTRRRGGR